MEFRELGFVDIHVFYCLVSLVLFSPIASYTQTPHAHTDVNKDVEELKSPISKYKCKI